MTDSISSKINTLPPLPDSFHEINTICNSDEPNINDLAKAVEKDPMLVADLLKAANSPLYSLRSEIKSVLQAVSLFGISMTRALCLSISAKTLLKIDTEPYGINPEEFANISNAQGALANFWYSKVDPKQKDFLFLCALLQEIGKIFIAEHITTIGQTDEFRSKISQTSNIEEIEDSYACVTTAEITASIFNHWRLDERMIEAIKLSKDPINEEVTNKEAIALYIIRKALPVNAPLSEESLELAKSLLEKTQFDVNTFSSCVEKIKL